MAASPGIPAIVAELEPLLGPAGGEPVPLDGGITNRNYRVRLGGEEYVVRLPGKDTAKLGISRQAERVANAAAAALGIAPAVVAASDAYLVTRFIECRQVSAAELADAPEPAARALRAFHDRGPELPVPFWVPDLLEEYARIVLERGGSLPDAYGHARAVAAQIAAVRPTPERAPCHNDLLTANLIRARGGALLLVDWEYAGMGDPFFDLGNLSINNEFDVQADMRLLTAYLGSPPGPREVAGLRLMRAMSDVREAAWGVVQGTLSELDFDFAGYAEEHFARLRQTTTDPRYEEYLNAAST
jgi:thiamine kinase-like enzyme